MIFTKEDSSNSDEKLEVLSIEYNNFFLVLIIACLDISYIGASSILEWYFNPKLFLSLIYLNKCIKPSKCKLPVFYEHISNLCTAKHKSTLVDDR